MISMCFHKYNGIAYNVIPCMYASMIFETSKHSPDPTVAAHRHRPQTDYPED